MGVPHLVTAEELEHMGGDARYELVRGELVPVSQPGGEHGELAVRLAVELANFVRPRRLGTVYVETGFILSRHPDTVRGPDVAFLSRERRERYGGRIRGFIPGAPDLAVEIRSPADTLAELSAKAAEYLQAGTRLVWVIDPIARTAQVHRPGAVPSVLRPDASLDGDAVIPGFALRLNELFAEPE
ncbi:MAG TPA: Uma2 family endonuclease [Gemmatimonadales bacterium]|jgi:Uma2 family endonuclease|nr:Uma2 family endonuclease [Gemmatimonadales bacterium]